jgi:hypothetical protein
MTLQFIYFLDGSKFRHTEYLEEVLVAPDESER